MKKQIPMVVDIGERIDTMDMALITIEITTINPWSSYPRINSTCRDFRILAIPGIRR